MLISSFVGFFFFFESGAFIGAFKNGYFFYLSLKKNKDSSFLRSTVEMHGFVLFLNIGLDGLFLCCRRGN